jgi:hypothetical protein
MVALTDYSLVPLQDNFFIPASSHINRLLKAAGVGIFLTIIQYTAAFRKPFILLLAAFRNSFVIGREAF